MMRNKNNVAIPLRSVACAGINPRTLEDVCCMPLHKFRANCTCTHDATRRYSSSRSFIFPSFPRFVFLISFSPSPVFFNFTVSLLVVTRPLAGPRHCRKVDISASFPRLSPFLVVHTSIRRSLRAATSNYSNASRVQRG